jgi:CHAT domain-containing protein/Tfp pilus assembly protein PilF
MKSLNGLAFTYYNRGQYEKALFLLERLQTDIQKIHREGNWLGAYNLTVKAMVYGRMGKYDKAFTLYRQALVITKKVMGKDHSNYVWISNNFASLYTFMGLHKEAIPLYQEAIVIKKEIYGENGDSYGGNLFDLAHAYIQLGQYTEALPLFEQASAIMQKSFGEKHQYYAMAIDGQAFIYERLGSYNKAMSLYEKVLAIYKEAFGESHPYYASSLNNIAALHLGKGEYNKALFFYQQALRVRKNSLKEDHPDYAQSLINLGVIYERKELYDSAFHLYEEALVLTKKAVGEEHHFYANCLAKLASLHSRIGNYETALNSYQQALAIRKKIFGGEHPDDVDILNCLGLIYGTLGNSSDGSPLLIEASTLQLNHLKHTYSILSELEKMIFLNKEAYQFNYIPSVVFTDGVDQGVLINQAYSNELALKGMVLEDQQTVLNSIRKSEDTITLSLYNHWRFNKAFLGKQLLLPLHQRVSYFDSLQEFTNQLEQQISRRSLTFSNQQHSQNIKVIDIAQHLKKTEAAVEFIRFPLYNKKLTDSVMYAAMLLLPDDSVARFIPLCEEKQLLRLLASSADATTDDVAIEQLYGNESGAGTLSDSLYQLSWKPIEKWLEGISTVYYAPTGLLHRIAFQSLRPDATHFLIDKYRLNQVLSTRSVVWEAQLNSNPQSAGVWGNISYTMNNSLTSRQPTRGAQSTRGQNTINTSAFSFNFYNADTRVFRGGSEWDTLPSTRQEMDSLKTVFQLSGISITGYSGSLASEEAFKKMDGKSPQILHLATHGFFLPVTESKSKIDFKINAGHTFKVQQNPMFRSGLVLAGGNNAWKGEPAISGKEDGILTAYEIAQMDLSNTELVVLSACETALGDVQGNEGVIGLQRAFKMAGVKQLMVSLWSVYDKPTMELMTLFYRNRLSGHSTGEALRNAQLKIKEKYSDPYYWAGFVLIE